ncbi:MAG: DUF3299 domain-containing protein [Oceanicaulis sp.]
MTAALRLVSVSAIALLALACSPQTDAPEAEDGPPLERVDASLEAEQISWRDLMPEEELEALDALNEGRADPSLMAQFTGSSPVENQVGTFNVVEDLAGLVVRMPGYILPLDYAQQGEAREFLLLPFHGACVHYPPPPPNQIVYLRSPDSIEYSSLWEPVWVEGRMEVERVDTDLAATAYTMVVRSVSAYQP